MCNHMKRKVEKYLEVWLRGKTALLIDGARQVGKTYILKDFAVRHFKHLIYKNLFEDTDALATLKGARNAEDFLLRLSALVREPMVPGETVIFIDEIQEFKEYIPEFITLVKFLVDGGKFRFMFSGSLLGVALYDAKSWPTGYLSAKTMYPMDFEEFLWAGGINSELIHKVQEAFEKMTPVEDFIHTLMQDMFSKYIIVGGMPAAVKAFFETGDLNSVALAHEDIETYYKKDVAKYAREDEKLKIKEMYEMIPDELNSKTKRFHLNDIAELKRGDDPGLSISWLKNAGVAIPVYTCDEPKIPLRVNTNRNYLKLFHADVGMLVYLLMDPSVQRRLLTGDININFGSIYENVAAQLLQSHGFEHLYYYNKKKAGEVDFLVEYHGSVLPVEIKSGKDYERHRALNNLLESEEYDIPLGMVFCNDNVAFDGSIARLPVYMLEFLRKKDLYFGNNISEMYRLIVN